jgi:hypothetical protein
MLHGTQITKWTWIQDTYMYIYIHIYIRTTWYWRLCVEVLLKRRWLFLCKAAPKSWIGALHAMHGFMIIDVPGTEKGIVWHCAKPKNVWCFHRLKRLVQWNVWCFHREKRLELCETKGELLAAWQPGSNFDTSWNQTLEGRFKIPTCLRLKAVRVLRHGVQVHFVIIYNKMRAQLI